MVTKTVLQDYVLQAISSTRDALTVKYDLDVLRELDYTTMRNQAHPLLNLYPQTQSL